MRFETLQRKVARSERLVEGRAEQTMLRARATKTAWRQAWTPGRIVIAGLVSGFALGRSDPSRALRKLGKVASPRWLQAITAISGLVASLQAAIAAATAKDAAETAGDAAADAHEAAAAADPAGAASTDAGTTPQAGGDGVVADDPARPKSDRSRPDPVWTSQPSAAAEAATDVSER